MRKVPNSVMENREQEHTTYMMDSRIISRQGEMGRKHDDYKSTKAKDRQKDDRKT